MTFEGEDGGCAIGIDRVKSRHLGDWKCKVLTPRRGGGSAVEYGYFSADEDEPRRSRLGSGETQQGFSEGEEAELVVRSDVYSDERSVKFFWIVGRSLLNSISIVKSKKMYGFIHQH